MSLCLQVFIAHYYVVWNSYRDTSFCVYELIIVVFYKTLTVYTLN